MLNSFFKKVSWIVFFIIVLVVYVACEKKQAAVSSAPAISVKPSLDNLVATTNPAGAEYYIISVAQSKVLNAYSGIKVTVQPATGSVAQFQAVKSNEAQFGMSTAQGMVDAWEGQKTFEKDGPQSWLRAIQCGSNTMFGLVTRKDTGITSIPELKGKRVTFNFPADLTARFTARQEMVAFGLNPDADVNPQVAEFTQEGFANLKDGKTDAAIGALKNPTLLEVATVSPLVVLPFPADKISFVQQELPGMFPAITEGVPAIEDGIPIVGSPAVLYSNDKLPDDVAYIVIKTLIENIGELIQQNEGLMKFWSKENAVKDFNVPYHPGAIKYYKEIGIWSDVLQAKNDELLKSGK
jgi:TRAP transporter TAXI family solute receptor